MSRFVGAGENLGLNYGGGYLRKTAKGQSLTPAYQLKRESVRPPDKRRNAMVEYALVLAAFCAILIAIVAIAQALRAHHSADNATRQAAPYALVRGALRQG